MSLSGLFGISLLAGNGAKIGNSACSQWWALNVRHCMVIYSLEVKAFKTTLLNLVYLYWFWGKICGLDCFLISFKWFFLLKFKIQKLYFFFSTITSSAYYLPCLYVFILKLRYTLYIRLFTETIKSIVIKAIVELV